MELDTLVTDLHKKIVLDGQKLAWHKERVDAWRRGERIAPITIDWALTRSCTYNCYFCYATLQDNDIKKITKKVIFRFLDDAAEIGVKAISLVSDGESTCSPHVYDCIKRGKANGLDMAMGTNGYLLDDSRLKEILPCMTYLRFNFSAGTPKRYAQIMGVDAKHYNKVINTVKKCVKIKRENNLDVTIGLQMVLQPKDIDQVIPLSKLGKKCGVDYVVIKHCSDDEKGSLGVDYKGYFTDEVKDTLVKAESMSTDNFLVKAKWSKIMSMGQRHYNRCFGTPFIFQISGSGLVAPCGKLFNKDKYAHHHIDNIANRSFKEIWMSDKYWEKHNYLHSDEFNPQTMCGK